MTHEHKACYGTMFHDTLHFETNREMKGKVFGFEVDSLGLARADRSISVDIAQWDDCLQCPEFDHCYKLCMARLTLTSAIAGK